jgi:hypothetical protein
MITVFLENGAGRAARMLPSQVKEPAAWAVSEKTVQARIRAIWVRMKVPRWKWANEGNLTHSIYLG